MPEEFWKLLSDAQLVDGASGGRHWLHRRGREGEYCWHDGVWALRPVKISRSVGEHAEGVHIV